MIRSYVLAYFIQENVEKSWRKSEFTILSVMI